MSEKTLYERLGGYDSISAFVNDLLPRLQQDPHLTHFWHRRPEDSLKRSKQLLIDFLCSNAGGPVFYTGRDMLTSHKGMKISEHDWSSFMKHLMDVAEVFKVPHAERDELIALIQTTKVDLVEA